MPTPAQTEPNWPLKRRKQLVVLQDLLNEASAARECNAGTRQPLTPGF